MRGRFNTPPSNHVSLSLSISPCRRAVVVVVVDVDPAVECYAPSCMSSLESYI